MEKDIPDFSFEDERLRKRPSRARYDQVHLALERKWRRRELKCERMMREVTDALWDAFAHSPYSWCGFYLLAAEGGVLVLGPHRDQPAGSPLSRHGVCGRAAAGGRTVVVPDVGALADASGERFPGGVSEIILPVFDKKGKVWAIFVAGSARPAAFDEMDQRWLEKILRRFENIGAPDSGR